MFIHRRIFFNEKVAGRDISFRLIVVVIGNEILHGVFRKKLPHFAVKLRRQRFVGRHHQGGFADAGDDVGHRKSLPGSRYPQKRLTGEARFQPLGEFFNRFSLIPCRIVGRMKLERRIGKRKYLRRHNTKNQKKTKNRRPENDRRSVIIAHSFPQSERKFSSLQETSISNQLFFVYFQLNSLPLPFNSPKKLDLPIFPLYSSRPAFPDSSVGRATDC